MLQDVDHSPARVSDEEPPHAPFLVGERVHDLRSGGDDGLIGRIDVVDADAHVPLRSPNRAHERPWHRVSEIGTYALTVVLAFALFAVFSIGVRVLFALTRSTDLGMGAEGFERHGGGFENDRHGPARPNIGRRRRTELHTV